MSDRLNKILRTVLDLYGLGVFDDLDPDLKGCFLAVVQVLKTRVLQCEPERARMLLSFKTAVEGEKAEAAEFECEIGKVR